MKAKNGQELHNIDGLTVALGPQSPAQWDEYATRIMEPGNGADQFSESSDMTYAEFWQVNKVNRAIINAGPTTFKTATILEVRSGDLYIEMGTTVFYTIEAARINLVIA